MQKYIEWILASGTYLKYSQIFWIEFQPQFSYERLKEGIRYAL